MESRLMPASFSTAPTKPLASSRSGLVKVSTITVASPTAAEHTMQPANIKENSLVSVAACINCNAQAINATTASTISRPMAVKAAGGMPWKAVTNSL